MVGSVAGQRYWSTLLPPEVNNVSSATWTPDDQFVYLGTSQGGLLIMDIQGNTVASMNLRPGLTITDLIWNCERFNMEEQHQKQSHTVQAWNPPTSVAASIEAAAANVQAKPDGIKYLSDSD